jgi:putative peptide zinc metalloprotease protein
MRAAFMTGLVDDAVVTLFPLHIGAEEDGACEVGRPDTGYFVSLPLEGVALVTWLGEGLPLAAVRERFSARYGVVPDLEDFLSGIEECGFVRSIGDRAVGPLTAPASRGIPLLASVSPQRLRWLLSRPMRAVYILLWISVPLAMLADPVLAPRPSDALLVHNVLLNALLVAVIAWTLVMAHEFAHATAARAVGCTGRFSISRRLWFLVGQTELTDVRTLPRRSRYAPYLAGMTWDLLVLLGCLCAELAGIRAELPRTVAYTLCLMLIYQFSVFMRTDIYYVIANWLRLGDLMGDTQRLVANMAQHMLRRPPSRDITSVPARELRIIRWYAVYYLLGSACVTAAFLLLSVPALVRMLKIAVADMAPGPAVLRFWSGAGFAGLVFIQFGTLTFLTLIDLRRRRLAVRAANAHPAELPVP